LDYGFIGVLELLFFFVIVIVVVGPRRIWRGYQVIRGWIRDFFYRLRNSQTAKRGRGIMRGLGKMAAYFNRDKKKDDEG
jgi:hypothetical protein